MNLATRKIKIINWISRLEDESIINKIEKLQTYTADWWDRIDELERAEIEKGIIQADNGELKTTEEVMSKYRK